MKRANDLNSARGRPRRDCKLRRSQDGSAGLFRSPSAGLVSRGTTIGTGLGELYFLGTNAGVLLVVALTPERWLAVELSPERWLATELAPACWLAAEFASARWSADALTPLRTGEYTDFEPVGLGFCTFPVRAWEQCDYEMRNGMEQC